MGAAGGRPGGGDHNRPPRPHAMRRYGQNHLVDKNILHAIVDQAAVGPDDVILEVGAAGGLLTGPLLERARLVHAFEIDRRWLPRLEELAVADPRLVLHAGDALKADLGALDPPPTALVANLAYNIAIPLLMITIAGLPSLRRWAVMVQRELGERLFAVPSTKAYSAVSVQTQLACRIERVRPVPASAFRPQPRVESSFISFVRRDEAPPEAVGGEPAVGGAAAGDGAAAAADTAPGPEEYAAVTHLVRLAFGQRRKTLVNSLSGAAHAGGSLSRDDVRETLRALALSDAARPEELAPPQWRTFAAELGRRAAAGPAA